MFTDMHTKYAPYLLVHVLHLCMYIFVCMFRSSSLRRKSMLESRQSEQPQLAAAAQTKPAQQTDVRM